MKRSRDKYLCDRSPLEGWMAVLIATVLSIPGSSRGQTQPELSGALANEMAFMQTMSELIGREMEEAQSPLVFEQKTMSPSKPLLEVAKIKWGVVRQFTDEAAKSLARAREERSPQMREVWLRDAQSKSETARSQARFFLGADVDAVRASPLAREKLALARERGRELAEAAQGMVDAWRSERPADEALLRSLNARNKDLLDAQARIAANLDKLEKATFRAEQNFWMAQAELEQKKVQRLSAEIAAGLVEGPERARIIPELVNYLRSEDPDTKEHAYRNIQDMIDQGWGGKVLPELVKRLKETPSGELFPGQRLSYGALDNVKRDSEWQQLHGALDEHHDSILRDAQASFDKTGGISGAGGISLHSQVRFEAFFDPKKVLGAAVTDGRLTLFYDGRPIRMPTLDMEHLALAMRCILDDEGTVEGRMLDSNEAGIVIQTPKDRFGQVVWKKEFLPATWVEPVGEDAPVSVLLGPAFGLSGLPMPSMERGTYYGSIQGTRMGRILFESDAVLRPLLDGVSSSDGKVMDLSRIPKFATLFERRLRASRKPVKKPATEIATEHGEDKPWMGYRWYVWVPDDYLLRLNQTTGEFEFVTARMKLTTWSMDVDNLDPDSEAWAREVSMRYAEVAQVFPILKDLVEVGKAVTIVRWLKAQRIETDLEWARKLPIKQVDTPLKATRFAVQIAPDLAIPPFPRESLAAIQQDPIVGTGERSKSQKQALQGAARRLGARKGAAGEFGKAVKRLADDASLSLDSEFRAVAEWFEHVGRGGSATPPTIREAQPKTRETTKSRAESLDDQFRKAAEKFERQGR